MMCLLSVLVEDSKYGCLPKNGLWITVIMSVVAARFTLMMVRMLLDYSVVFESVLLNQTIEVLQITWILPKSRVCKGLWIMIKVHVSRRSRVDAV